MIEFCDSDDQLGMILAHEMSHAILGHLAETLSNTNILAMMSMAAFVAIWAILPTNFIGLLVHNIYSKILDTAFTLPYSRKLEYEADEVGLMLAAKSCLDVRSAAALWRKMHFVEYAQLNIPEETKLLAGLEWLQTHPSSENRATNIEEKLPAAIKLRESCNCPRLPSMDPRVLLELELKALKHARSFHDKLIHIQLPPAG